MVGGQEGASGGSTRYVRVTWEWARSVIIAVLLFLGVRAFLVEAFKIPTSSMEGTVLVGDYLLVNKSVYGAKVPFLDLRLPAWREPARGEVVVFHPPHDPHKNYVKRVVGVPGAETDPGDRARAPGHGYRNVHAAVDELDSVVERGGRVGRQQGAAGAEQRGHQRPGYGW